VIASLTGKVQAKSSSSLVLDVNGVGYQVFVPNDLLRTAAVGEQKRLHTELVVREDAFVIFGFDDFEQLSLFQLLKSVTGVGPKTALAAISNLDAADISNAVANDDSKVFERVPGIGAKTAKLIVVTLAGKLNAVDSGSSSSDLLEALQGLGWPERVAQPVAAEISKTAGDKTLASLIKEALAILGANK
jgi:Holliday junction DNA helicase RuvA